MAKDIAAEIMQALHDYADMAVEEMQEIVEDTAKECRDQIQATAPVRTGAYAKSWTATKAENHLHHSPRYGALPPLPADPPAGVPPRQAQRRGGGTAAHRRCQRSGGTEPGTEAEGGAGQNDPKGIALRNILGCLPVSRWPIASLRRATLRRCPGRCTTPPGRTTLCADGGVYARPGVCGGGSCTRAKRPQPGGRCGSGTESGWGVLAEG